LLGLVLAGLKRDHLLPLEYVPVYVVVVVVVVVLPVGLVEVFVPDSPIGSLRTSPSRVYDSGGRLTPVSCVPALNTRVYVPPAGRK
jgi:hypothetical protein